MPFSTSQQETSIAVQYFEGTSSRVIPVLSGLFWIRSSSDTESIKSIPADCDTPMQQTSPLSVMSTVVRSNEEFITENLG